MIWLRLVVKPTVLCFGRAPDLQSGVDDWLAALTEQAPAYGFGSARTTLPTSGSGFLGADTFICWVSAPDTVTPDALGPLGYGVLAANWSTDCMTVSSVTAGDPDSSGQAATDQQAADDGSAGIAGAATSLWTTLKNWLLSFLHGLETLALWALGIVALLLLGFYFLERKGVTL